MRISALTITASLLATVPGTAQTQDKRSREHFLVQDKMTTYPSNVYYQHGIKKLVKAEHPFARGRLEEKVNGIRTIADRNFTPVAMAEINAVLKSMIESVGNSYPSLVTHVRDPRGPVVLSMLLPEHTKTSLVMGTKGWRINRKDKGVNTVEVVVRVDSDALSSFCKGREIENHVLRLIKRAKYVRFTSRPFKLDEPGTFAFLDRDLQHLVTGPQQNFKEFSKSFKIMEKPASP